MVAIRTRSVRLLYGAMVVIVLLSLHGTESVSSSSSSSSSLSNHRENYAVIVSSSQYWFNYRHTINALTMYNILKEQGNFTDDRIILMLADEYAVNNRNPYKNYLTFTSSDRNPSSSSIFLDDLYKADEIEIDYRGHDVTVENLARVLSGRSGASNPLPVLPADTSEANIFVYLTGHGGDSFFKFQDVEEIMAADLAALVRQRSFHKLLFMADTCQAFTLGDYMEDLENVIMIGSSLRDESSYAHHSNSELGLSMIERYTFGVQQQFQQLMKQSTAAAAQHFMSTTTLCEALVAPYSYESQRAHIGIRPASLANASTSNHDDDTTRLVLADFFVNRAATALATPAQVWSPKSRSIKFYPRHDDANQQSLLPLPRQYPKIRDFADPLCEGNNTSHNSPNASLSFLATLSVLSLVLMKLRPAQQKSKMD